MGGAPVTARFDCRRLEAVFRRCFAASENTLLLGGAAEPIYLPAGPGRTRNELHYREDYFASALHEAAHWCIAGSARRRLVDFGYWYAPEGRGAGEQRAFEAVEVEPQALEWIFSLACGYPFRVSVDNFGAQGELPDSGDFRARVAARARLWQAAGLSPRAERFRAALGAAFGVGLPLDALPIGGLAPA